MEESGICVQAFIPMRKEPDERSEMTSQVLYGESFTIIESKYRTKYSLIRLDYDHYEGWIDSKTIYYLTDKDKKLHLSGNLAVTHEPFTVLTSGIGSLIIGCGSTIRINEKKVRDFLGNDYYLPPDYENYVSENKRSALVHFGKKLLNIPYLWGGRSSFGFDCSGLCQNLYKQVGINIPRDSGAQSSQGKTISFIDIAKEGDLAFFDNEEGKIIHAGVIIDKNLILHCSGKVRIDRVDHQGIYSLEQNRYTHRLRIIKSIINQV